MSDELSPEELDALKRLPRERVPSAGLEERVVGSMRERGFIAPAGTRAARGRLVRLTSSRVAGLVAACIVLMVGAYTIGVRHGENPVLRGVV
ncbi:MAG TPA: hypothetical protein VFH88_06685, partial [Candidatus Krumholzibacteria bacterium]|nr:hypothetical protein [Candidatus Krumholzibacteria bacterium]